MPLHETLAVIYRKYFMNGPLEPILLNPLYAFRKYQILSYYKYNPNNNYAKELSFLKKNKFAVFPYHYIRKYDERHPVLYDQDFFPYVVFYGKRLYFPKSWAKNQVSKVYSDLLTEQDTESPHKYETTQINECDELSHVVKYDDIVVDIGAAEGIFSLSVIDKVKKAYLFEYEDEWIEPLQKTFAPYNQKVEIVKKFVSDNDTAENQTTLDKFFYDKNIKIDFLKIDVEGYEDKVLVGAKQIIKKYSPKISVCVYHRQDMADVCKNILEKDGYECNFSDGYMLWFGDAPLNPLPPYFRHGLIRASKIPGRKILANPN